MATVQKREKGLQKHSLRGYTPEQLNGFTQEQVIELFRARQRRRFARSNSSLMKKSNTNTTDFILNVRKLKRTPSLEKSQHLLKPT